MPGAPRKRPCISCSRAVDVAAKHGPRADCSVCTAVALGIPPPPSQCVDAACRAAAPPFRRTIGPPGARGTAGTAGTARRGLHAEWALAVRYGNPSVPAGIDQRRAAGCERILGCLGFRSVPPAPRRRWWTRSRAKRRGCGRSRWLLHNYAHRPVAAVRQTGGHSAGTGVYRPETACVLPDRRAVGRTCVYSAGDSTTAGPHGNVLGPLSALRDPRPEQWNPGKCAQAIARPGHAVMVGVRARRSGAPLVPLRRPECLYIAASAPPPGVSLHRRKCHRRRECHYAARRALTVPPSQPVCAGAAQPLLSSTA